MTTIEPAAPQDWRTLQDGVARILTECGLQADVEKTLPLARGSVDVDVFAIDPTSTPAAMLIIECKHWSRRVSRNTVHALRTVVEDAGVHYGMLISSAGFQRGAREAAEFSNVSLQTWDGFQALWLDRWVREFFTPRLREEVDPLLEYTEPINSRIFKKADLLPEERQAEFKALRSRYGNLAFGLIPILLYPAPFAPANWLPDLPLRNAFGEKASQSGFPASVLDAESLRSLLTELTIVFRAAIAEFDTVFGERA